MGDAHGGVRRVHALATLAGGPVDVDAQVLVIDLHVLDLVGFGVDQDAGGGGLDASLRLGHGDTLHPVDAALELEDAPCAVTGRLLRPDRHGEVLDATQIGLVGVQHFTGEAVLLGVALVHAHQLAGEQCGLFSAGTGLDLHDHVIGVVGVTRGQQVGELLLELRDLRGETVGLGGELGVLGGHLRGGLVVFTGLGETVVRLDDRLELAEPLGDPTGRRGVIVQLRVGELHLQALVLREDVVDLGRRTCQITHRRHLPAGRRTRSAS